MHLSKNRNASYKFINLMEYRKNRYAGRHKFEITIFGNLLLYISQLTLTMDIAKVISDLFVVSI